VIPEAAVEAAARALCGVTAEAWQVQSTGTKDKYRWEAFAALEAAAPHMIQAGTEIGYVCRHGHFQFIDDPDGDACGTKRIGTIYVKADDEVTQAELTEAVDYAIESHHRKMEEWRAL